MRSGIADRIPTNADAQQGWKNVNADRPSSVSDYFDRTRREEAIRRDEAAAQVSGYLKKGQTLEAQGDSANGLFTTLHYADDLTLAKDKSFRTSYAKAYKLQPDVYAVQGYDAAQLLAAGLKAAGGDISKRDVLVKAMEQAKIDSPRGAFTMSKAHNPVQDIYLRQVDCKINKQVGVAVKGLADPARGCKM